MPIRLYYDIIVCATALERRNRPMKFLRRFTMTLLTLALCVGLFLPLPVSAADL